MKRFYVLLIIAAVALFSALAQNPASPFIGRWDMTVTIGTGHYPSWLEVTEKNGALEARVQQPTGNVAPVPGAKMDGSRLIVTTNAASPARPETIWELTAKGGKLTGMVKSGDKTRELVGVRAPELKAAAVKSWAAPE